MSKNIAIVFAGGVGARMGSGLPKQFIEVNGKPIIIHTLDIFEEHPDIDEIYVACKEEYIRKLQKMVQRHMIDKVKKIVPGGATGQDSIYNALQAARENNTPDSIVLIHDGVRPCISKEVIDDDLACVKEHGNAITCTPLFETPVISEDGKTVDTCSMMKMLGKKVSLVAGPRGNIKVTTPEDLYTFRAMIQYRESEQIFGFANREVPSGLKK